MRALAEQEVVLLFRSLKFGRLFGIDIFLHWTMWILPLFILVRGLVLYDPDEAILQFALVFGVYVGLILHELAHRRHMNHSNKFWQEVERLCPDYLQAERWLKQNAKLLR